MRRARQRDSRTWLAVAIVATVALTGCSGAVAEEASPAVADRPVRAVDFDFEHQAADLGTIVPSVTNEGTAPVAVSIVTLGGGRAMLADGVEGGFGLRFPAFDSDASPTAAAVVVRSADSPDLLSPGRRDFRFGADFALDRLSAGGSHDNGDNLVQRGLTEDAQQFKIQVDHGVPSCRVAGTDGIAFVESEVVVVPERWYRVTCLRTVDGLVLTVVPWNGTRWGDAQVSTVSAPTGSLDFDGSVGPLVIGAKVDAAGTLIASASDQFNGLADNVHFEVIP
jgi:hypothetical protein